MNLNFKSNFSASQIKKDLQRKSDQINNSIFTRLQFIGENFIVHARNQDSIPFKHYTDRTGNLKSSIGYIILKDGQQVFTSSFQVIKKGEKGSSTGAALAASLASKHPKGWILFVVAGMEYAKYVELKGYDVLHAGSVQADAEFKKFLNDFKRKVN